MSAHVCVCALAAQKNSKLPDVESSMAAKPTQPTAEAKATTPATPAPPPPESTPRNKAIETSETTPGEETSYAVESTFRTEHIYPSNWGLAGIFRVRSGESLPEGALTFGIGGEFYAVNDAPNFGRGTKAQTIAESLFVGYSPTKNLSLGVMRRNSSTTFGEPSQLISSLGDMNFTASYSFPLSPSFVLAPILDVMVASDFNNLAPAGNTVSGGLGAALSYSLYPGTSLPMFLHANVIYHTPQIRGVSPGTIAPESFFNFSRYDTITLGLGAEYRMGDFMPFLEMYNTVEMGGGLGFGGSPSKASIGTRITPLSNKGLAVLVGADIGLGRTRALGVPFTPGYQILGQLSYTFGLSQTERKHYVTTQDVNVVDRKFIIKKNISFKIGSAELLPESTTVLDQIAQVIKDNKVRRLLIIGHTDSSAPEDYNIKLSLDRANTVKKYLVGKGIAEETLIAQGYGKRKPRASNATEDGRALNRRVEFFILE